MIENSNDSPEIKSCIPLRNRNLCIFFFLYVITRKEDLCRTANVSESYKFTTWYSDILFFRKGSFTFFYEWVQWVHLKPSIFGKLTSSPFLSYFCVFIKNSQRSDCLRGALNEPIIWNLWRGPCWIKVWVTSWTFVSRQINYVPILS